MKALRRTAGSVLAIAVAACGQSIASPTGSTSPPVTPAAPSTASLAPASPAPAPSAIPVLPEPIRRISLPGSAPAAMVVAQEGVWVYSIESGDVTLTDPSAGTSSTSIHIGGFGSHLVLGGNGHLFAARFETGGSGSFLVDIDPTNSDVSYGTTGALGALTAAGDHLYALEKDDRLLQIDMATLEVTASAQVDIDDEHMEAVIADGAVWLSSDHTPLQRLSMPDLTPTDTIDVGGGIPFVVAAGRIWGARPGTLWVLDPATKAVEREILLPGVEEILGMDIDPMLDEAWLAVRMTGRVGAVIAVDLANGAIVGTSPVSLPAAVKLVGNDAYVASYLDNELLVYRRLVFVLPSR